MVKKIKILRTISLIATCCLLSACGGSSSSNEEDTASQVTSDVNSTEEVNASDSTTGEAEVAVVSSTLTLKWSVDTNESESVFYDSVNNVIYVSNHAGGDGYVSKVDVNGSMISQKWFDGLDYPMGMSFRNNQLYVANNNFSEGSANVVGMVFR